MKENDWNDLYKMGMGELFVPDNNTIIRRVPGGWIYSDLKGICFIPYPCD